MKPSIIHFPFPDQVNRCYLCGRYGQMHLHHCLHGIHRKNADKYGLTVHLCPECHRELHDHGKDDLYLEQTAQRAFERLYGREEFLKVFGKSWL